MHLLDAAEHLVREGRSGAPRQVNLRRAVSSVYYALFHWLARCAADSLVGAAETGGESWTRVYRALNHRDLRHRCRSGRMPSSMPQELRRLGSALVRLQPIRNGADYNPTMRFDNTAQSKKCAFAVHVLFKERRD